MWILVKEVSAENQEIYVNEVIGMATLKLSGNNNVERNEGKQYPVYTIELVNYLTVECGHHILEIDVNTINYNRYTACIFADTEKLRSDVAQFFSKEKDEIWEIYE